MARRWGHAAATASLAGGCTPPHDVHARDFLAGVPTSAPSDPPQNASARSRMCTRSLPWASLLPGRAAQCSSPGSTSALEAHYARLPQAPPRLSNLRWLQPPGELTRDHWQTFHNEDRQTTVASSSFAQRPLSVWPRDEFVRTSQRAWARSHPADGSSDSGSAGSGGRRDRTSAAARSQ